MLKRVGAVVLDKVMPAKQRREQSAKTFPGEETQWLVHVSKQRTGKREAIKKKKHFREEKGRKKKSSPAVVAKVVGHLLKKPNNENGGVCEMYNVEQIFTLVLLVGNAAPQLVSNYCCIVGGR